jgi:hypothetical protein
MVFLDSDIWQKKKLIQSPHLPTLSNRANIFSFYPQNLLEKWQHLYNKTLFCDMLGAY